MFVCVCVWMVTQLQAELGIVNYHISTSREKPQGCSHKCSRVHRPHISLELRAPAEKLKHPDTGWGPGGVRRRKRGGLPGWEEARGWRVTFRRRLNRKPPVLLGYRPRSDQHHSKQPPHLFLWGCRFSAAGGDARFNHCCVASSSSSRLRRPIKIPEREISM